MKYIAAFIITITFSLEAHSSQTSQYFEISEPEIVKLSEGVLNIDIESDLRAQCENERLIKSQRLEVLDVLDDVINLGEKIWSIVKDGQPTADYQSKSANALPSSADCAFELTNWQRPMVSTYQVTYKNGFNMTVVSMIYRVIYTPGGKWQGAGNYLTNVSIHPYEINVSWGFNFNANVQADQPINLGSLEDPLAGLQISLEWDITNPMSTSKSKEIFFIEGTGEITKL